MSFLFEERMLLCFLTTSLVHSMTIWSGFFYATGTVLVAEKNFMLWGEYPREIRKIWEPQQDAKKQKKTLS